MALPFFQKSSQLPIADFRVTEIELPVSVPFAISRETLSTARIVLISLRDADGETGLGEAAPFPTLTFDTAPAAATLMRDLAPAFIGKTPDVALTQLSELAPSMKGQSITALAGLETALWDLAARQRGLPLAQMFGNAGLSIVDTDVTLPIMPPEGVANFWQTFAAHRFQTVKIKVSGNVSADLDLIHAMLRVLPAGAAFTLDGNQGYRLQAAQEVLARLAERGHAPLFFEQPLPEDDWAGLARLSASSDVPVCLDETVRTAADAQRTVREKTARIINLKIMKCGLAEVHRIAAVARAGGLELMIGGMLESEVTMTASLHFACGMGTVRYFDLDTPFFMTRRVTKSSPWHTASARLHLPTGNGLGLTMSD